jgi:hypothetical protein
MELVLNGGQLSDVMPPATRAEINETAEVLSLIAREPVAVSARMPALVGMGGLRFTRSATRAIRPYVEGTGGLGLLRPRINFLFQGQNVSAIAGSSFEGDRNNILVGISSGVLVSLGRFVTFDVGYRYLKGFESGTANFGLGQTVLGLGTRF